MTTNALSSEFLTDLRIAFSEAARQGTGRYEPPVEDLRALTVVFDNWRQYEKNRRSVSPSFLTDLRVAFADATRAAPTLHEPPAEDLRVLAATLDRWRAQTIEQLREHLSGVESDDPVRCPVSLFGPMDCGRLETVHTRTLRWLLDPKEGHGFGTVLLDAVFSTLGEAAPKGKLCVVQVRSEHPVENQHREKLGRLDIVAEGHASGDDATSVPWVLLIEAKIDANEGHNQLNRYDEWLQVFGYGKQVHRVFLTPDGRPAETSDRDWVQMGFLDLACLFRSQFKALQDRPGYHFLRFYVASLLKDICRWSLPVVDSDACFDPYSFVQYLKTVAAARQKGPNDASTPG